MDDDYVNFSCVIPRETSETLRMLVGYGQRGRFGRELLIKAGHALKRYGPNWAHKVGKDTLTLELVDETGRLEEASE